jgi:ATP synthase F1 delta subunit
MSADPIAARYAEALFHTAKAEGQIDATLEELRTLKQLLSDYPLLLELFLNPDVDPPDKVAVLEKGMGEWSPLVKAFFQTVIGLDRGASVPAMVEAFEGRVDREQRRLRVIVRTARPLSAPLLRRLQERLEQRENARVELKTVPGQWRNSLGGTRWSGRFAPD